MLKYDTTSIRFLEDTPQSLSEDDLRHKNVAERIADTVRSCPTPFTIGLSGEWGSGKTSIAEHVRVALERDEERMPVVYFDAWKFQHDSLRREFLIETHRQLLEGKYLSKTDLTSSELYETRSVEHSPEIDWREIWPPTSANWLLSTGRLGVFLVGLIGFLAAFLDFSSDATRLVSALIGGTSIYAFFSLLPRLLPTGIPSESRPPITSGEEFGNKFKRWLSQPRLQNQRLLIVVDNVDRCNDDQIVELLGDKDISGA